MNEIWISLSKLSKITDVPEPTVRRYVHKFNDLFTTKKEKRLTLVHVDSIPLLQKIYLLSLDGKGMDDIREVVSVDFPSIYEFKKEEKSIEKGSDLINLNQDSNISALIKCVARMIENQEEALQEMKRQNVLLTKVFSKMVHNGKKYSLEPPLKKTSKEDAIKLVAKMVEDGWGKKRISNYLNNQNIPSMTGKGSWSTSTIQRLIEKCKELDALESLDKKELK